MGRGYDFDAPQVRPTIRELRNSRITGFARSSQNYVINLSKKNRTGYCNYAILTWRAIPELRNFSTVG